MDDEVAGVFAEIDHSSAAHEPVNQEDVSTEAKAEGSETTEEKTKTEKEVDPKATAQSDEGQSQTTEESTQTNEPSKTESGTEGEQTSEDKTPESKTEQDFSDWQKTLPPPPAEYQGKKPEFNDEGQITNMNPQEYLDYTIAMAQQATRKETYTNFVESQALNVAEQIIPDIKSNPNVRRMVENTRIASILSGNPIDTVQAALQVRDLLGIAPERIQAAKSEGANSTKASIEVQKNAALETGSTQKKSDEGAKITQLQKRVQKGDDTAFAELLGVWEEKGLL